MDINKTVHTYRLNGKFCTAKQWAVAQIATLRAHIAKLNADLSIRSLSIAVYSLVFDCIAKLSQQISGLKSIYNLDYLD